jgi:hypothetical protein
MRHKRHALFRRNSHLRLESWTLQLQAITFLAASTEVVSFLLSEYLRFAFVSLEDSVYTITAPVS